MNEPVIKSFRVDADIVEVLVYLTDNDEQTIRVYLKEIKSGPRSGTIPGIVGCRLSGVRYDSTSEVLSIHWLKELNGRLVSRYVEMRGEVLLAERFTRRDITQMIKRGDHVL